MEWEWQYIPTAGFYYQCIVVKKKCNRYDIIPSECVVISFVAKRSGV